MMVLLLVPLEDPTNKGVPQRKEGHLGPSSPRAIYRTEPGARVPVSGRAGRSLAAPSLRSPSWRRPGCRPCS